MGIRARHMRVDERRAATLAAILHRVLADGIAFERVGAVAFRNMQIRKAANKFRNAAAGSLHFDGYGNGITIVFDEIQKRQLLGTSNVEGLPEFAFTRRSVSTGDVDNLIALVVDVFAQRRFLRLGHRLGASLVIKSGFGRAHGLYELRAGTRRLADDVQLGLAPMRRHLTAAGAGIVLRSHRRKKHFQGGYAEHEAERAVAVIRINPVDSWAQEQPHRRTNRFVPGAGDLEVDFVLAFQLDLAVVKPSREKHRAVNTNQGVVIEAVNLGGVKLCKFDAGL